MKKMILAAALAVSALAANAQVYVGGEMKLWRNTEHSANNSSFAIAPELGFILDEQSEVGLNLGFAHEYNGASSHKSSVSSNAFSIAPYYRQTVLSTGKVKLFIEGGLGFATASAKVSKDMGGTTVSETSDGYNSFEIGLKPGVTVDLTNKVAFVAHAGFLGYRTNNDKSADAEIPNAFGSNGFGLDMSTQNLSFGFVYKF